ncbi:MAG: patatin-like phospholipase family protein [Sterolibacterium sp.]
MEANSATHSASGRLGLCLSGGGFRAALFHIGTLAALAERGLLHRVEVLSTVSGGSIIGAYFYLKVKQLLEGRRPGCSAPQPAHYLDIVKEIESEFLEAVQKNLRLRLLLNPYKTARMLLEEEYSRSDRLSELLDSYFYNFVALAEGLPLQEIHITPVTAAGNQYLNAKGKLSLQQYNASAAIKIPVLTINATCLNTGHPFHFTGSWIGEPERNGRYRLEENSNIVLPQLRFDGTHRNNPAQRVEDWQLESMRKITLADAVAASAAVPGIFPPLPIHNLYRDVRGQEIVVELSDGGVFDNQGLDALLDAHCTQFIVSDASGQLEDERLLPTDLMHTAQRANDVMMERIRGYGYVDLKTRSTAGTGSIFMHLREVAVNTPAMPALPGPGNQPGGLVYRLSALRTDLDAFSDLEANVLMYQGYALTHDKLVAGGLGAGSPMPAPQDWGFLSIRDVLSDARGLNRMAEHLKTGKQQFFKTFALSPCGSWLWLIFLLSPLLLWAGLWLHEHWCAAVMLPNPGMTWGELAVTLAGALVAIAPISPKVRATFKTVWLLRITKTNPLSNVASSLLVPIATLGALILSLLVFVWLTIYNRIFLNAGKY